MRNIARYDSLTDTTTVMNHRQYDGFGRLVSETDAAVDFLHAYTGRRFDEATGLRGRGANLPLDVCDVR